MKEELFNKSDMKTPITLQQAECEDAVMQKIADRRDHGRKKYGQTMERKDLTRRQWLEHAQEEAMDFAVYLERCIREEALREVCDDAGDASCENAKAGNFFPVFETCKCSAEGSRNSECI